MASGEAREGRLDDVTSRVLVGIFIEETIRTCRSDSRGKDTLALGTGPVTRLLAGFESFHGTSSQSGARGLSKALFATLAVVATTAAARPR